MSAPGVPDELRAVMVSAIEYWHKAVQENPDLANCSLCKGRGWMVAETGLVHIHPDGRVKIDRVKLTCPRCEGVGKAGRFSCFVET